MRSDEKVNSPFEDESLESFYLDSADSDTTPAQNSVEQNDARVGVSWEHNMKNA